MHRHQVKLRTMTTNRVNSRPIFVTKFLLLLGLSLFGSASDAAVVQFDFNDNSLGALAGQGGGIGAAGSVWSTAGATHVTEVGDLLAPAGTNFSLTQSAGTALSVGNDTAAFSVGQIARPLDTPLTGTVWFSYLADVDDTGTRVGLGFNNTNVSTGNPRLLMLNDTIRFIGNTGDTGGVGGGYTTQTNLVVGRIDLDISGTSDELSVWVNPDVNVLGAPVFTQSLGDEFGSSISSINIQSYATNAGAFDFLTLSDGPNAFTDVTGAVLLTGAAWNVAGSGSWGTGTNWTSSPVVPDGLDATFGAAITGPATVTLDQDRAVNDLTFDNSNSYTLTANKLTIVGDAVSTLQGSHTVASAVEFAGGNRTLNSSAGANLNITGVTTTQNDAAATLILDGAGGGSLGAIRDNNDVNNDLDGTDNISLVKRGTGTWTIGSGTTTLEDFHGGNTTVEAGTLKVRANVVGGTDGELRSPVVSVEDGGTLDTSDFSTYSLGIGQSLQGGGEVDAGGSGTLQVFSDNNVSPGDDGVGTLNVAGNLTLNGVEGSTPTGGFTFELSDSAAGSNDQVAVTGNLVSNAGGAGNVTAISIIPTGATLQSGGSYEVITFGGSHTGSAADFTLDASLQTRFTQSISVDSDSVNVDISGSNAALVWRGNNGSNPTFWDVNTTNNFDNGGPDVFFDLDGVTFDDTAVGTTAEVQGTVTPASVTFNNSAKDITVGGAGEIAGGGAVTKSGTGRVTISNANSYSGATTITAGVLHAANNGALGDTSGGTFVNGGTLDITGSDITGEVVSIQGAGSDGRGALITDGFDALGGGTKQINHVVQTGPATIGAYVDLPADTVFAANDYRWDLEPPSNSPDMDASWIGNGHTLTKKGRGVVSIQRTGDMGGGDINIEEGTLFWQGATTSAGATVTIGDNVNSFVDASVVTGRALLSTFYSGGTGPALSNGDHAINLVLQGGAFTHNTFGFTQDAAITGTVTNNDVTGDSTIDNHLAAVNSKLTIVNGISGNGDLEFAGNDEGTIELQGNNTYTGVTVVSGVNVALSGSSDFGSSPTITITNDGTVDTTGRTDGTFTVTGQTVDLASADAVVGNLTTSAGSTVTVFGVGSASAGTATVQLTPSQDRRLRYNPNTSADGDANEPGGQLFVGTISTSAGASGNNDLTRSVIEFDLTSNANLVGVTDIDSVSLQMFKNTLDGASASGDVTLEVHELQQDFVFDEVTAAVASAGTPWTGYTLDGDTDTCTAAACALGSLVSTGVGNAADPLDVEFTDNQGGLFETLIETALAGDGSVKLLVKADATAEAAAQRALFRFGDFESGDASVLEISFSGTIAEVGTALIDGDFTIDASSTLELDIFSMMQSDVLDVNGLATLAGTINANVLSSSPLAVNDQITVLTTTGGIDDTNLDINGPFTHSVVGNDLVLTFTGLVGLLGDFDMDGDVDGTDFLVWQRNPAVGNLADWQANYGATSALAAATAAVPEPTGVVLLTIGCAIATLRKQRR